MTTMNDAQQIFAVFYAIFWGAVFSVSGRWKAFNFGAIFDKDVKNITKRISLALLILNVLPILYFVIIFYCLKNNSSKWECWVNISAMVLSGIIPAFGIFGFYRLWLGIIEINPRKYYLDKCSIPSRYHSRHELENQPEPSLEKLNILRSSNFSWLNNILTGLSYILLPYCGVKLPYVTLTAIILIMLLLYIFLYNDFFDIIPIIIFEYILLLFIVNLFIIEKDCFYLIIEELRCKYCLTPIIAFTVL